MVVHHRYPSRVNLEDAALAHQIVILRTANQIMVSCNCLRRPPPPGGGSPAHTPLAVRTLWQPGQAVQCWRDHMAEVRGR